MQTKENPSMRIINKSKDGVTIKVDRKGGIVQKMSWEEFNANFVMEEDKMHCHFTEEFLKIGAEIDQAIVDAATAFIFANSPGLDAQTKMAHQLMLGDKINKIQELAHCSMLDAVAMVRKITDELYGKTPATRHKETPEEFRQRKQEEAEARKRRQEEMNPHRTYTPSATTTMADVPGMDKLKDMFNK